MGLQPIEPILTYGIYHVLESLVICDSKFNNDYEKNKDQVRFKKVYKAPDFR